MMQSYDSFGSNGNSVFPYLRAYQKKSYNSVPGGDHEDPAEGSSSSAPSQERGTLAVRALVAVAVFLAFAAAVSTSNSKRIVVNPAPGGTVTAAAAGLAPPQRDGRSYGGEFEAFEKSTSGATLTMGEEDVPGGQFSLKATNEYGEFDRKALALYQLEMVVEPFRETRIEVTNHPGAQSMRFHWLLVRADSSGTPLEGVEPVVNGLGGSFATVELTEPGEKYALLVRQVGMDGSILSGVGRGVRRTITCKYVRRELRDLTEDDRTAFFSAMREFFTVSRGEGRAKYGEDFYEAKYLAAYHIAEEYCFHNGMHFLNAHAAFGLWAERSLQMINPKVSLAQWDFMIDAAKLGTDWGESEIWGPDMFGSAVGSPENMFQISDGWFANITSLYDPEDNFFPSDEGITPTHNPYGFIDAAYNFQGLEGVIRTYSYCGLEGQAEFTMCEVFVGCFESTTIGDWATCMEREVHASMHGQIGGGFDCNVDMSVFMEENPQFKPGLLTFTLEFLLANKWPANKLMRDYNECDTECDVGESCGCTCLTDPFTWTDDEVYDFMSTQMAILANRNHGENYLVLDIEAKYPYGFVQDGVRLDDDSAMLLLRHLMLIGCEPGKIGAMATGASPLDPIFWVLHTGFEKANHILQLSPGYRDTYDFSWDEADCGTASGGKLYDHYPFTEKMLGFGESTELLTNAEIQLLLHPLNPEVPYLYEGFNKWGTCTDWDPCPECSAAVSSLPE